MDITKTVMKESIFFYLIIASIVFVSMRSLEWSAALIAYSLIIIISYKFKKKDGEFIWGYTWKFGFVFGFILISFIFIIESVLGWIKFEELYPNALYILFGALVFEFLVSIGEEVSFRGYLLPGLIKSFGMKRAIFVTSFLFAILHIPSILILELETFNAMIMFSSIVAAGVLLALLYLIGGLKMSSGFHFSWNFFQYHIFSLRSGFGIFGLSAAKPEFTGGIAGPEAGILGLIVLILGIRYILWAWSPHIRKE